MVVFVLYIMKDRCYRFSFWERGQPEAFAETVFGSGLGALQFYTRPNG